MEFNNKVRPRLKADKEKHINTYESVNVLYEGRDLLLNYFKTAMFPLKPTPGKERKC